MSECRACASKLKGIMDYKCIGCCVRHLGELPNKDSVKYMYRHFEKFNAHRDGFSEDLKSKWDEFLQQRNASKRRGQW